MVCHAECFRAAALQVAVELTSLAFHFVFCIAFHTRHFRFVARQQGAAAQSGMIKVGDFLHGINDTPGVCLQAPPHPPPNTHLPSACCVRMPTCWSTGVLHVVACACDGPNACRLTASAASSSQSTTSIPSRPRSTSLAPQVSAKSNGGRARERERARARNFLYLAPQVSAKPYRERARETARARERESE